MGKVGKRFSAAKEAFAGKADVAVTEALLGVAHARRHIERDLLHDEGAVVIGVTTLAINNVTAGLGERHRHRQILSAANRMHQNHNRISRLVYGFEQVSLKHDLIYWTGIGVFVAS